MMAKSILFDLDGTLMDSAEGIINCSALTLEHFGIVPPPKAEMRSFIGPPAPFNFRRMGIPEEQIPEAVRVYRSFYRETGIFQNEVYPGIAHLLKKLKDQDKALYVATSKPEHLTIPILQRFDLTQYFTLICGAASDTERNTKEAVIQHLLDLSGGLEDPVMIGDTLFDVQGAAHFGIPTIGVSWGYGNPAQLLEAGALTVAHNTDELYDILTK